MRIAIVEEDAAEFQSTAQAVGRYCAVDGRPPECVRFASGDALLRTLWRETFDLLILDSHVRDPNGNDVLSWLGRHPDSRIPTLVLSYQNAELDIVGALDMGADDYVIKPFRAIELGARCRRLLQKGIRSPQAAAGIERFGQWAFDHHEMEVKFVPDSSAPRRHPLTDREFRLALNLFRNAGRPISRDHLLEIAGWPASNAISRVLDNHISRLRQKLDLQAHGVRLQAVYGRGYQLSWRAASAGEAAH